MLKLSWNDVTVPFGFTVKWKSSCKRKLFPGPCPLIRKFLTFCADRDSCPSAPGAMATRVRLGLGAVIE
jgi:hypothetical protein